MKEIFGMLVPVVEMWTMMFWGVAVIFCGLFVYGLWCEMKPWINDWRNKDET